MKAYGPFSDYPGLGDDEYDGFPADVCPAELPDLSKHHNLVADVFKKDPALYAALKDKRTKFGVGLAKCIKTGMDNRGHQLMKTIGLVAGDEDCFQVFRDLFVRVIQARHGDNNSTHSQTTAENRLTATRADETGKYVLSSQIRVARSLQGVRFPPAIEMAERREVERVVVRALQELSGPLKGEYYPLAQSTSFPPKPQGMSQEEEDALRSANLVFEHPDSTISLCSGMGRHWPDARGIFVNDSRSFCIWLNEEEHIRAITAKQGEDIQGAFNDMMEVLDTISSSLRANSGHSSGFAYSEEFGYLTSSLASIGTSMRVSVIVKLPLLTQQIGMRDWCAKRRLTVRSTLDEHGAQLNDVLEISNSDRLGFTELEIVNIVIESIAELVRAEMRLAGETSSSIPVAPMIGNTLLSEVTPEIVDDVREKTRQVLERGLESGALSTTLASLQDDMMVGNNEELEMRRLRMQEVLSAALDAGTLDSVLAKVKKEKELEDIRQGMQARLQAASDSGALEESLENRTKSKSSYSRTRTAVYTAAENPVSEYKDVLRQLLIDASNSGRLTEALSSTTKSREESQLEQTRLKALNALSAAQSSGLLETALSSVKEAQNEADKMQDLRKKTYGCMMSALETGELERVLSNDSTSVEKLRETTSSVFVNALNDGTLEEALRASSLEEGSEEAGRSLDDLRDNVLDTMCRALESGELQLALQSARPKSACDDKTAMEKPIDELRRDALNLLLTAQGDGRLETAMKDAKKPSPSDLNVMRLRMKENLESACDSGRLDQAFEELVKAKKESCSQNNGLEEIRLRMKANLEAACDAGKVGGNQDASRKELDNMRIRLRGAMEAACEAGDLEKILITTTRDGAVANDSDVVDSSQLEKVVDDGKSGSAQNEAVDDVKSTSAQNEENEAARDGLRQLLADACVSGQLERELDLLRPSATTLVPSDSARKNLMKDFVEAGGNEERMVSMMGATASTIPLFQALSNCDRRIGALTALIEEVRRRCAEADDNERRLEDEVFAARREAGHLAVELDQQKRLLDDADAVQNRLQEKQRKLHDDLDDETLKQRHCMIDLDGVVLSARSDLSTVCTVRDIGTPSTVGTGRVQVATSQRLAYDEAHDVLPTPLANDSVPMMIC